MTASKIVGRGAIPLIALLACSFLMMGCVASGIKVLVVNSSGKPVRDMKITYTGGSMSIPELQAGGQHQQTIQVSTATDVAVEYVPEGGEKKSQTVKVQLEPGYVGELRLEVVPAGGISWKQELSLKGKQGKGKLVEDSPK